jgi:hypothetical protein
VFWVFGAGLVALFVAGWPRRPGPAVAEGVDVPPEAAPALHALVAAVADAAGVPPPARVRATPAPVLAVTGTGRARTLVIGTPLWGVLAADARVAWAARALAAAHAGRRPAAALAAFGSRALGQWRRQLGDHPAEGSLGRLDRAPHELVVIDALASHSVLSSDASATRRSRDQVLGVVHVLLSAVLAALHRCLTGLGYRSRVAAALAADATGLRVAGRAGAAAALDAVPLLPRAALSCAQAARRREPVSFRETVVGHLTTIPPAQRDRLRRDAEAAPCRPGDTTPPLRVRRRLVDRSPATPAAVTLSPEAELAIDMELAAAVAPVEDALRNATRRDRPTRRG